MFDWVLPPNPDWALPKIASYPPPTPCARREGPSCDLNADLDIGSPCRYGGLPVIPPVGSMLSVAMALLLSVAAVDPPIAHGSCGPPLPTTTCLYAVLKCCAPPLPTTTCLDAPSTSCGPPLPPPPAQMLLRRSGRSAGCARCFRGPCGTRPLAAAARCERQDLLPCRILHCRRQFFDCHSLISPQVLNFGF